MSRFQTLVKRLKGRCGSDKPEPPNYLWEVSGSELRPEERVGMGYFKLGKLFREHEKFPALHEFYPIEVFSSDPTLMFIACRCGAYKCIAAKEVR
jgi:hypothetical protein